MDGVDDDGDGLIDCSDPDCVGVTCSETRSAWCVNLQCAGGEDTLECGDGLDNDNDGVADCDDPDCGNSCSCGECEELCDDGLDNDEDGAIDEGCPCTFRNLDRGVCVEGSRQPDASCAAPPSYQPNELLCDGQDNDCDGVTDEGCACRFQDMASGVCAVTRVDVQGSCREPRGFQATEISCDGFDNDCDGNTDEGCAICDYLDSGVGVCQYGVPSATSDECTPPLAHQPDERACDNLDNDCDGLVDESCPCVFLSLTAGVCARAALDGNGTCLEPEDYEQTESSCDGFDNDCDGLVDEGCDACRFDGSATGVCAFGVPGANVNECASPGAYQVDEGVCDGLDNDCDGVTDEGCPCFFDDMDEGVCAGALIDPTFGSCSVPEFYASTEVNRCDGLDNNCDGVVDEGCACDFLDKPSGVCATATRDPGAGFCDQPSGYVVDEETGTIDGKPVCDGRDNDCDGVVDEGCPCDYLGFNEGVCKDNGSVEEDGTCERPEHYVSDEVALCDGLDNDCDGVVDEEGCAQCDFANDKDGVCANGIPDGMGSCQAPLNYAAPEGPSSSSCGDDLDNDCDGVVDEGCPCNYQDNTNGVCGNLTTRSNIGECAPPADYEAVETFCDGFDNDCDGVVDEGCLCDYGGVAKGVCIDGGRIDGLGDCSISPGTRYDGNEGAFGTCDDGMDNDCDGIIDEGCECNYDNLGFGVCRNSTRNSMGVCEQPTNYVASDEGQSNGICGDNQDNDCDGFIDEGCPCDFLGNSKGVCASVLNGSGTCEFPAGFETPFEVSCSDGLDNDCDGMTDNADPECSGGGMLEVCDDGIDNDGDGRVDCDDFECVGTCGHFVFVTTNGVDGSLNTGGDGRLGDADAYCQNEANSAGLNGNFKAVISGDGIDASSRINLRGAVYNNNVSGGGRALVFAQSEFFAGNNDILSEALAFDEYGVRITGVRYWTGSTPTGGSAANGCQGWSSASMVDTGSTGFDQNVNSTKNGQHLSDALEGCDQIRPLLCISGQDPENCTTAGDDDLDGFDDANDPDCMPMNLQEICDNGVDDDNDGHIDCSDDECTFGGCAHTVFVAQGSTSPNFGTMGEVWADDVCQSAADGAMLGGTWRAVFSTAGVPATERIFIRGDIYNNAMPPLFALSSDEFFSSSALPAASLAYDESNTLYAGPVNVWTGSTSSGAVSSNETCADWTDGSSGSNGAYGQIDPTLPSAGDHLFKGTASCDVMAQSFLCINGQRPEVCSRRGSQDGDQLDDSLDPDCGHITIAELCNNGEDDDGDGYTDLDDSECTTGAVTMFTTREDFDGDLGGLNGADAICQEDARNSGRHGSFRAVLSDSTYDVRTRVDISSKVYNTNSLGANLCFDHSSVDTTFYTPAMGGTPHYMDGSIGYDATGSPISDVIVWSGSTDTGYRDPTRVCIDWSVADATEFGRVGRSANALAPLEGENLQFEVAGDAYTQCDARQNLVCVGGQPREQDCSDNADDDSDGAIDCDDPDCGDSSACSLRLFVTNDSYTGGELGSRSSMDAECDNLAGNISGFSSGIAIAEDSIGELKGRLDTALMGRGAWTAVRSSDDTNGNPVAFYTVEDLLRGENPEYLLAFDENGDPTPLGEFAWTGLSSPNLDIGNSHCGDWTENTNMLKGVVGQPYSNSLFWINEGEVECDIEAHLYCLAIP